MNIQSSKQGACTIVTPQGRMDISTSKQFEEYCSALIDNGERCMVIDLNELEYVSSAGLRSILSTGKKLKSVQGDLKLCRAKGAVKDVLELSGIAAAIPILATLEECGA